MNFQIGAIVMAGNGMGFGPTEHPDSFGFLPWACFQPRGIVLSRGDT